jgi:hypothetical protein
MSVSPSVESYRQCAVHVGTSSVKSSRQSSQKTGQLSKKSSDRVVYFLTKQHPLKTAACVCATTKGRVAECTVRKWLERGSSPSFSACLALIGAYGASFLAVAMYAPPLWLDDVISAELLATLMQEQQRLNQDIANFEATHLKLKQKAHS